MTHAADRRCDIAAAETPATRRPVPSSAVSHGGGGQCAWVTTGPAGFADAPPAGARERRSATPDHPHARWNPSRPGSPGPAPSSARRSSPPFPVRRGAPRDAPEEIREVQRSEQLARDFVLRRDAERGASSRASSKIPHVHQPAPRPREHRLAVRAHPHAVHGRFRVRGGDELGAGFPPAHRASQR